MTQTYSIRCVLPPSHSIFISFCHCLCREQLVLLQRISLYIDTSGNCGVKESSAKILVYINTTNLIQAYMYKLTFLITTYEWFWNKCGAHTVHRYWVLWRQNICAISVRAHTNKNRTFSRKTNHLLVKKERISTKKHTIYSLMCKINIF